MTPAAPQAPSTEAAPRILVVAPASGQRDQMSHELTQTGLRAWVVNDMASFTSALARYRFEGAIIDYQADPASARRFAAVLREHSPPCLSVMLSHAQDPAFLCNMLGAGAHEPLCNPTGPELIAAVVRTVRATRRLWGRIQNTRKGNPHRAPAQAMLSAREVAVLRLIALGFRYQEIGRQLSITERTVKMHAARLRKKTKASDRYALVQQFFASDVLSSAVDASLS